LLPSQEHSVELSNVGKALGALATEHAEVLHLVGVLGFTYSDAAEVLGVPTGTVMSRLSRARHALRDNMDRSSDRAPSHLRVVGGRRDGTQ
jgi:DNA-directed RNA polymerase specialized sigma24 family protein